MKMLEDRIRKDGIVREGNVLKVDSFINHQMDIPLFREMAKEWKRLFAGKPVNKVLTIEASGIGIAAVVASEFNVPVVFAKKSMSINLDYDNYETKIQSFTHKKIYNVIVSKKFLTAEDHVLIIDDFLANGCALMGLLDLAKEAGATVEGIGIAVEKGFQQGGDLLAQDALQLRGVHVLVAGHALLDAADDLHGRLDADVRGDEHLLQVVEHVGVDRRAARHGACEFREEARLGLFQPGVELPPLLARLLLRGRRGVILSLFENVEESHSNTLSAQR